VIPDLPETIGGGGTRCSATAWIWWWVGTTGGTAQAGLVSRRGAGGGEPVPVRKGCTLLITDGEWQGWRRLGWRPGSAATRSRGVNQGAPYTGFGRIGKVAAQIGPSASRVSRWALPACWRLVHGTGPRSRPRGGGPAGDAPVAVTLANRVTLLVGRTCRGAPGAAARGVGGPMPATARRPRRRRPRRTVLRKGWSGGG